MRYPCLNVGESPIGWIIYIDIGENDCCSSPEGGG